MLMEWIALLFIALGTFFSLVGVVGIIRLPDVYSRIHASGKVATMGIFGLLIGTAALMPEALLKLLGLGVFLLISSPVASHAIAAAAYRSGIPFARLERNDIAQQENV
jgi:multicomponent Na+:H+ antiporter subunit G